MSRLALALILYTTSALSLPTRRSIKTKLRASAGGATTLKGEAPLAVAGACVGVSLFGYHLGVVNAPLQAMAASMGFGDAGAGAVVSSTLVGAAGGALLAGPAADRLGRRGALRWNCLTLILAAVGCSTATTLQQLIYARTLAGVGIGLVSAVAPLYVSEVSPAAKRGRNGALNQVAICLGIVASIVAGLGVTPTTPAKRWRPMFAGALVPTLLHLILTFKIPESPRWPGTDSAWEMSFKLTWSPRRRRRDAAPPRRRRCGPMRVHASRERAAVVPRRLRSAQAHRPPSRTRSACGAPMLIRRWPPPKVMM